MCSGSGHVAVDSYRQAGVGGYGFPLCVSFFLTAREVLRTSVAGCGGHVSIGRFSV